VGEPDESGQDHAGGPGERIRAAETGSQEIHTQLTTLRDTVQALARSDWQGAELSIFGRLCQQWNTAAANLREALDGLSMLLANGAAGPRQP
jgi:uncharacterized protein YukE